MSPLPPKRPSCCTAAKRRDVPCVDGSGLARGIVTSQAWDAGLRREDDFGEQHGRSLKDRPQRVDARLKTVVNTWRR
jgi:hypothetical protein